MSDSLVRGTAHRGPRLAGGPERDASQGREWCGRGRRRGVAELGAAERRLQVQRGGCGEPLYPAPLGSSGPSQADPRPRVRESPR